jgi:Tol biopolymer transport system component
MLYQSWSSDGRWIYFASDRSGKWEVWRIPSAGGLAIQVTHAGGYGGFESVDGTFFYYAKGDTVPGIWRVPTNGGEETEVFASLESGYWGYWALTENGIYYLDTAETSGMNFFNFTTQHTTRVFDLESHPAREATGIALSPDGRTILYTQLDMLSRDIFLVDNYR